MTRLDELREEYERAFGRSDLEERNAFFKLLSLATAATEHLAALEEEARWRPVGEEPQGDARFVLIWGNGGAVQMVWWQPGTGPGGGFWGNGLQSHWREVPKAPGASKGGE